MFFAKASIPVPADSRYIGNMISLSSQPLTSCGHALDMSDACFGELRDSSHLFGDGTSLRTRLEEDGYLYLRGFFQKKDALEVRRSFALQLEANDYLQPGTDLMDCIARTDGKSAPFRPDFAENNAVLKQQLYSGRLVDFYRSIFNEPVRHFDFTWVRTMRAGNGSKPHCDMTYMGRGEREKLLTAWIPWTDAPTHVGGLMILEGSHLQHERLRHYLERDVDSYCSNAPNLDEIDAEHRAGRWYKWDGTLSKDPASLRQKLGGRWLTTDFTAGDLLTFPMYTVHASLDNKSDRVRISTDTRYQPASRPADERWIGEKPLAHSYAAKRGRVC